MPSQFTTNKNLEMPASGSYNDVWSVPVNSDWLALDTALGGNVSIVLSNSDVNLSLAQYLPPNIILTGTLSADVYLYLPAGVGGIWSIFNATAGAFTVGILNTSPGRG